MIVHFHIYYVVVMMKIIHMYVWQAFTNDHKLITDIRSQLGLLLEVERIARLYLSLRASCILKCLKA